MSSYIALSSQTLSSSASSVTFSSIPTTANGKTLRDLIVVAQFNHTGSGAVACRLQINGDTGSNYNFVEMSVNDSGSAVSGSNTNQTFLQQTFSSAVQNQVMVQIFDFAQTNKHKSLLTSNGNTGTTGSFTQFLAREASRWASTSAITSLTFFTSSDSFAAGSTFSLYGIEG